MKYAIKNGLVLKWDGQNFVLKNEDVFVDGSNIESIGNPPGKACEYTPIDASDHLVMPGLINTHTHVYMNFMKNSADELEFNDWLFNKILPVEAQMTDSDFYWTTLLGCIEMIKTGTTCYLDMHIRENQCAKAATDSGMRAFIGKCLTGEDLFTDGKDSFKKALLEKAEYECDRIKFVLSPHSVYLCSPKMLSQITEEAKKRNMLKHIHLSESQKEFDDCLALHGKTPTQFLESLDFLDNKTLAAHCVKLTEQDISILQEKAVNPITNPSSNAKLGNGLAPISQMFNKNINVCLGTDSAASNNTLNMFREMNVLSLIHKAHNGTAIDFSTKDVLKSATLNPALAFNMQNKIGIIQEGAYADLIFINLKSPSLFPNNNIVSSLCYSANGSEVDSVMINGEFVMKDNVFKTLDSERIYYETNRIIEKYVL